MTMTDKQRAKINAALCMIHDQGHNVQAIQGRVRDLTSKGHSKVHAYESAVGAFLKANPTMERPVSSVMRLIQASDSNTVARYNDALSKYIETGDNSAINALEPTVRQDAIALAVRNGELTADDAAAGRVDWGSMGIAAPEGAAQQFQFAGAQQAAQAPQPEQGQPTPGAPTFGPTGVRTGPAAERWARAGRVSVGNGHAFASPPPRSNTARPASLYVNGAQTGGRDPTAAKTGHAAERWAGAMHVSVGAGDKPAG